jgi:hypothetical protein
MQIMTGALLVAIAVDHSRVFDGLLHLGLTAGATKG